MVIGQRLFRPRADDWEKEGAPTGATAGDLAYHRTPWDSHGSPSECWPNAPSWRTSVPLWASTSSSKSSTQPEQKATRPEAAEVYTLIRTVNVDYA